MLTPTVVAVERNRATVERLVAHCHALDGTHVKVIHLTPAMDAQFTPHYPGNAQACRAAFSLHVAAQAMAGQPFIWLEHDSIPLRAGWAQALSHAYAACGKPYLLTSDSHSPHDLVGGIGVYGPDTTWQIPTDYVQHGWDLWMMRHLRPLVATTPLIQHSYGCYNADHICTRAHTFPRDAHLLRPDAVVFHRCVDGTLYDPANRITTARTFFHSGDLGDIIYQVEVMRRMGGGKLALGPDMGIALSRGHTREPMTVARMELIRPLLEAQPWVHGVSYHKGPPDPAWVNLNEWRMTLPKSCGASTASLQRHPLRHCGLLVQDETRAWLEVEAFAMPYDIVVARSPRYHNDSFPWAELVKRYGSQMRFVGLYAEYKAFCEPFGSVAHVPTANLLELAQVIASASCFIGNQSCPYAIAEALKRPCVQETWPTEPNCLFERPDALQWCVDVDRITAFVDGCLS